MKNVIPVPNIIIQNKDLSFTEKVIYALGLKFYLFSGDKHSKKVSAFKKYLINDLRLDRKTINKYVDELVAKEYIEDDNILLQMKNEVYTYNNQDSGIFAVPPEMKHIGWFTRVPLKVLTSKELSWKDKAVYMALKRSWEKCPKNAYYCLNTIDRFEEYNLSRTEKNVANLKSKNFIDYTKEKTGVKVNDQKITTFIFNGFEEETEEVVEVVAKNAPTEKKEETFMEVDYQKMLREMEKEDQRSLEFNEEFEQETFSEALKEDKIELNVINDWVKNLQEERFSKEYCDDEIEEDSELYQMMMAL